MIGGIATVNGLRATCCALLLAATAFLLVGCTDDPAPPDRPTTTTSGSDPGASSAPPTATPTAGSTAGTPTPTTSAAPTAQPTSSEQPVPKVGRSDVSTAPTISAAPADTDGTVRYRDGVSLQVVDVEFAEETTKGPGSFPGRAYAVLTLRIANRSAKNLSLDTVVVTVLDKAGQPVAPVYTEDADVSDFAGSLRAGKTLRARYAFAVPKSSRSKVTVVVDFDGVHTSAVFRGKLD